MTNNDFWKHIDTIIAQGFDAHGLKQLEVYAELFISGRLVYQRFSPLEQHGCAAGGSNHVIASLLAGAGIDPSSLSAPEGSFQRERECAKTCTIFKNLLSFIWKMHLLLMFFSSCYVYI